MKKLITAAITVLVAVSAMGAIIYEDFSSPTKQSNGGANGFLGTGGAGYDYNGNFGTWLYAAGNMGIDDPAEGDGSGSSDGNAISSVGMARPQDERGTNARALSLILEGSEFSDGVEYTVSFDVIGDQLGKDNGRFWLAELYGYDNSGSNYIQIDGTYGGWNPADNAFPFVASGSATVNYLTPNEAGNAGKENGADIVGDDSAGTNTFTFSFTYDASNSADIGFAVGTYNNIFAIDNFEVVPEPATMGLFSIFGAAMLLIRRHLI